MKTGIGLAMLVCFTSLKEYGKIKHIACIFFMGKGRIFDDSGILLLDERQLEEII
jgi:hypothetical protein